jgi:hypothetical protein
MKTYARIENGRVVEIIGPMSYECDSLPPPSEEAAAGWLNFKAGDEVPIERRFPPEVVSTLVDIAGSSVKAGDVYGNGIFAPFTPPLPSPVEILARNTATRDMLLAVATSRIAPLQDAADLGMATAAETSALTTWKQYRVAVNRMDLTTTAPNWPIPPS